MKALIYYYKLCKLVISDKNEKYTGYRFSSVLSQQ